ncbi:Rpn family recombination-promoting nuclease/putative transposase [Clostridium sp. ZS2-4]|uniref:Rpn family recombination-promoting nuclease/putative transposase n=1 Tax=Clostridium sp. ZS2-4 TaxID=2987703 RepID=UPI00227BDF63|nr:Rpn family recombination-promoting nuclease/putative transposase [Clostridium sp. ZS2-4]MCY6356158.1 Rpn family recombination-promoting nuclease/putative transposase [Clostridium sp. ZS2-4]
MGDGINNEHDLGYKSILSNKKNFIEFMRSFVKKDWVDVINEDNIVLIDKEFILEDFKAEEADLIYKANIEGRDIIFYMLLELQSKVDFRMPIRLLMYMTEIWRDELSNTDENLKKKKEYRLPAIIPIVLYNGKNNWTAVRNFKEILSGYELFEDNVVDFKYLLFDVNRMDKNELIDIAKVLIQISEKEGDDMVSNLGDTIIKGLEEREKAGIQKGIQKGIEEGRKEEKIAIARNLLDLLDAQTIAEKTGLTVDEVKKMKN